MQQLDEALERVRGHLVERLLSGDPMNGSKDMYRGESRYGDVGPNQSIARLRLDFEQNAKKHKREELTAQAMIDFMKSDLEDLIVNGDVRNGKDALLKSFSGEKVRGKKAVEVDIFSLNFFWEPVPKKGTVEYTLFLLMYVRFE